MTDWVTSMESFNLALLGKQAWNLISNPTSLMARVLKAKYFPNTSFLEASLGHNPSFIWRSLWNSQFLLAKGIRWRVGDGHNIRVWRDPWLRDSHNFYIESPPAMDIDSLTVKDLINPITHQWDIGLLQGLFCNRDVKEITNIPLSMGTEDDKCIWHYGNNGKYSVRSGYKIAQEVLRVNEDYMIEGEWQKLWKLKIPPKVRTFLWRTARDVLPNRGNLQKKHITVPISCATCGNELENSWHLFIFCPLAKQCWENIGLWHLVLSLSNEAEGFVQWLFQILSKAPENVVDKIAMVLWGIWKARNEKLWNKISMTAHQVVDSAMKLLSDWKGVREIARADENRRETPDQFYTWRKPQAPALKCNVDATIQNERRKTGMGMILRDSTGSFISARTNAILGLVGIKEAEAMAFKEALSWVKNMGLQEVIFESDSKVVIDAVNSQREDDSEFGILISQCQVILRQRPSFEVCFTRRQANKAAHNLARVSCFHASPMIWTLPPDSILDVLHEDCNDFYS